MQWIRELLEIGYTVGMRATGPSMHPFVNSGERVWLRTVDRTPSPGDVLMALRPDSTPVIHRVRHRRYRDGVWWFQTCGDRSRHPDPWLRDDDVVGVVVRVETAAGRDASFRALTLGRVPIPLRRVVAATRRGLAHWESRLGYSRVLAQFRR
ncbi:MAG: S24/S26 family peptidase [Myxococcota bacterium]